ncbi:MAG: hypothetical protein A2Y25_02105 [Candidatus Melainabacteria bacterium GWF2_37_15]|nr:MAG: hypothetical protein A2Y25_02105 [Candidatus Melainabacteria bacterium GWF2_37_15]
MLNKNKRFQIYLKGENKTEKIRSFKRIGDKYSITFTDGKTFTYNIKNVRITESALCDKKSANCFDYLKEVAAAIGLKVEIETGKVVNILSYNYSKIDFVLPDSMLGAFLCGKLPEVKSEKSGVAYCGAFFKETKPSKPEVIIDTIYPFGFNASQKDAVDKALTNQLSIIEGPPGTGKTQTILNIIANAVMRGESVAVVSSNNSATKNVFEKLEKYKVDFIAAYLGNTANKKDFINSQKPLPDMTGWKLLSKDVATLQQKLKQLYKELQEKLFLQNELSALKQELSALKTEEKHFLKYFDSFDAETEPEEFKKIDKSEKVLKMWLLCETYENTPQDNGLMAFIKRILEYLKVWSGRKTVIQKLLKQYSRHYLIAIFQQRFYELKIAELTQRTSKLKNELDLYDFSAKMREYSEISAQLFRTKLAWQYANKNRKIYELS